MPRKKGPPSVSWSLRVFVAELDRWKRAAKRRGITVSEFVKRAAERESERILEPNRDQPETSPRSSAGGLISALAGGIDTRPNRCNDCATETATTNKNGRSEAPTSKPTTASKGDNPMLTSSDSTGIKVQVTFDGDEPLDPISLSEWIECNRDGVSDEEIEEVSNLGVGGFVIFGGGAGAGSRVERIS